MPPMLILWIDATNSIVYEWVKIAINEQRAKGREHRAESIGQRDCQETDLSNCQNGIANTATSLSTSSQGKVRSFVGRQIFLLFNSQ